MKSVIRTPCWFTAEIIGADEFEEANPHTWDRWSLSNMIFENVTASSGNTADAASGEHEMAASVSGSRIPAETGKSWNGNEYRFTAQCARVDAASAWKLPSCSGEVPDRSMVR